MTDKENKKERIFQILKYLGIGAIFTAVIISVITYEYTGYRTEQRGLDELKSKVNLYNQKANYLLTDEYTTEAIALCNEALNIDKNLQNKAPFEYGMIQLTLGNAYLCQSEKQEPKEKNLDDAIYSCREALKVYTLETYPYEYAKTQNCLGKAYRGKSTIRNQEFNLNKAFRSHQEALTIFKIEEYPFDYAYTQDCLGNCYEDLAEVRDKEDDKEDNLKKAMQAYEDALNVFKNNTYQRDYARVQNNLGIVYNDLAEIQYGEEYFNKSILAYKESLKIYTIEDPYNYARVQNNLGITYQNLAEIRDKEENLNKAIDAYGKAIRLYSDKDYPHYYAIALWNRGDAYRELSELKERDYYLYRSINDYNEALKICTVHDYPIYYAGIQNSLGIAYVDLSKIKNKEDNLNRAICAYNEALNLYKEDYYPLENREVKLNLELAQSQLNICY